MRANFLIRQSNHRRPAGKLAGTLPPEWVLILVRSGTVQRDMWMHKSTMNMMIFILL